MDDLYDLIRNAVLNKRQVVATYRGHVREMSPHVLGLAKSDRLPQCLFYQFGGSSSSGLPPEGEWRCLPLAGLSNVSVRDGAWHTGESHTQPQTCVWEVHVVAPH